MGNTSTTTMKPGRLVRHHHSLEWQVCELSYALYEDAATEYAIYEMYEWDEAAFDARCLAADLVRDAFRVPTEVETDALENLLEDLEALCITYAPEGYTFGERRCALGFWTAEEMDNN